MRAWGWLGIWGGGAPESEATCDSGAPFLLFQFFQQFLINAVFIFIKILTEVVSVIIKTGFV